MVEKTLPTSLLVARYSQVSLHFQLDSEEVEVEEDDGNEADDEAGDDEPDFYQGSHLPSHPRLSMAHLYQHPSNASFTRTPSLVPS